jgi:ribosomal protein L11 methyltransferase
LSRDSWTTVRVRVSSNRAAVINALFELGAEGVEELEHDVVTHFRQVDEAATTALVHRADPDASVEYAPTPAVDWSAEWRSRIGAHRVGGLVVVPPWLAEDYHEWERIVIDPGMAFGTGEHETTRGVIRLLPSAVRPHDTVADLGAGSAVLAIAAAKLGAQRVVAIELDADAIGNANENVARNGVASIVSVLEGDAAALLPLVAPVRVILANIVSSALIELLPVIGGALTDDGVAILSGILLDERDGMLAELARAGWKVLATDQEGSWWSVTITRR